MGWLIGGYRKMTPWRVIWSFSRVHGGRTGTFFKLKTSPFLKISPNFITSIFPISSFSSFTRRNLKSSPTIWSRPQPSYSTGHCDGDRDEEMDEFLSRFVWIMRRRLVEFYRDFDKQTLNSMLLLIVKRVVSEMEKTGGAAAPLDSGDFSEDLWKTVKEVGGMVMEEMQRAKRKEKMKNFLQSEEVKEMYKFAWDSGVRGELLRELRFKWAREALEKHEAYLRFEKLRREEEEEEEGGEKCEDAAVVMEENSGVCFPLRKGKMRYKIYGLDLSDTTWESVADRIHEASETIWPPEAKEISGKCKLATEKIICMSGDDDAEGLLAEWASLVQPRRVDWTCLLDRVKEKCLDLHFKVAEMVLKQESYETNIRDYYRLIDHYAERVRVADVERLLLKMTETGFAPDLLIISALVRMYAGVGDSGRAAQAMEALRRSGFRPGDDLYRLMVMAHVDSGDPRSALALVREMETVGVRVSEPVYLSLLRGFCRRGEVSEAHRIATTMQFEGIRPTRESCGLMVEAYGRAGDAGQARANLDHMRKLGFVPDDTCLSTLVAAYEKGNNLDKALHLLLELERDGVAPGPATYSVLVGWLARLTLVEEVEQLLYRISELGEDPGLPVHVALCSMYARTRDEGKALAAFRALESRKEMLGRQDFESVISGFRIGGFGSHTETAVRLMETCGFPAPLDVKMSMAVLERARMFQKSR